ncbi:MAG: porin [Opitutae bacterium]
MKTQKNHKYLPIAALVAFAAAAPAAELSVQEQIDVLKARIQELDSKVRPLQRAETTAGDKGFILASPDAAHSLRVRSLVQLDSRWFGDAKVENDAFVLRRARIGLEGKLNKTTDYQITGEYAGSSATILDANFTLTYAPELQFKIGRFKVPLGLEQLQSDASALFVERSLVSQVAPNRDIGVQVGGDLDKGTISYAIGIFNGIQDGGNNADQKDANDGKDVVARVTFQPWINDESSSLAGLSFGVAGSYGLQDTYSAVGTSFKSDGQQTFFAFRTAPAWTTASISNTVYATGKVNRISPQFSYYNGGLSLLGEYIKSSTDVSYGASSARLKNTAWQLAAGYVLTGEKASYKGVSPSNDFDRASGSLGAFEVVGRVAELDIDNNAFTTYADRDKSATKATSYAVGLNWYLSKVTRLSLDYTHTKFDLAPSAAPAATSPIHHSEDAILTRLQLNF